MSYKNGDIVRWSYTDEKIEKMGGYSSTTYWCVSRFAIYDNGKFTDTFWHSSPEAKSFTTDQIRAYEGPDIPYCNNDVEVFEVVDVANINDLTECNESEFNYYDKDDCINISHPNMTGAGFYIRNGAKKSTDKMRKVILAHVEYYARQQESARREVERLAVDLENLSEDSYLPCHPDVYV